MARFSIKPNGEIVLIFSATEMQGLALCATEGYTRLRAISGPLPFGNQIRTTAAQRAVATLHMAAAKSK